MLPLRSLNHNDCAYVRFENQTLRIVDVLWINYRGELQKYVTLKPREHVNIDTFKSHPWIFVDRQTGVKMRAGSDVIYYPSSNREILRRMGVNHGPNFPIRVPVAIRVPLFTLRQISLQKVFSMLKDINDVNKLELPETLKRDIRRLCLEKDDILSQYD